MGLICWLPLMGTLENKGVSNVTITGTNITSNTSGKIGSCYSFNGSSSYIKLDQSFVTNSTTEFSYACWVKFNSTASACLFSARTAINNNGISLFVNNSGNILYDIGNERRSKAYSFSTGIWYHITFTYKKGSYKKIYVNGTEIDSIASTGTMTSVGSVAFIGASQNTNTTVSANYLNGYLNDIRIWNDHCLSAAEVKEISQGLVLHYKLDGFFGGAGENLVINGDARNGLTSWSNWGTATDRQVVTIGTKKWLNFKTDPNGNYGGFSQDRGIALYKPNTQYTISALMYASANASGRLWVHTRSTEGGANLAQYLTTVNVTTSPALYTFTFNTGSNASYTINKLNLMVGAVSTTSALDFYISNIKVEEGTKATTWMPCKEEGGYDTTKVEDSSGYNHNGTILNTVSISSDTPRYSCSTKLEAANSMINCGRGGMMTDSITVNMWIKSSAWANPVSCTEGGGWNFESSGDYFRFPVYISGVGYKYGQSSTTRAQICNNQWHMLTGIYDRINQKIQIYVDGQLDNDYATGTSNNIGYHGSNCIWIGAEATGSNTTASNGMAGLFSDFRIYATALNADAIRQLYEVGAKVDNKQNLHAFELVENNSKIQITKQGQVKCNELEEDEKTKFYQADQIIETNEIIEL